MFKGRASAPSGRHKFERLPVEFELVPPSISVASASEASAAKHAMRVEAVRAYRAVAKQNSGWAKTRIAEAVAENAEFSYGSVLNWLDRWMRGGYYALEDKYQIVRSKTISGTFEQAIRAAFVAA